jgi:hypothetical protein
MFRPGRVALPGRKLHLALHFASSRSLPWSCHAFFSPPRRSLQACIQADRQGSGLQQVTVAGQRRLDAAIALKMQNRYSPPPSGLQESKKVMPGCPVCGLPPTATQYVFYPKFQKIRCRGCQSELKYVIPGAATALLTLFGAIVGGTTAAVVWPAAWYFLVACMVPVLLLVSYIEAIFIQSKYNPVPIES